MKRFFIFFMGLSLMSLMGMATQRSPVNQTEDLVFYHHCRHFNDSWRCNSEPGCHWNRWEEYCEDDRGGGGGGHGPCRYIEFPDRCNDRHDCYWDRHRGCVRRGDGDGGGGRCRQYDNWRDCRDAECRWDRDSHRCSSWN